MTVADSAEAEELLEFLGWMDMDEEADALRADISQLDCARRVLRICRLAGLPISRNGSPGVLITPVNEPDAASQAYLGTGVVVRWQVPVELDDASTVTVPGTAADRLYRTIHSSMETLLAAVLQRGGCATVLDALVGDLIVRRVTEHVDPLYRDSQDAVEGR